MASSSASKRLLLGVGLILILGLLIALYVFLKATDNTLVYFVLLTILALSAAMLTVLLPGKIAYENGALKSGGGFAVFVLVMLVGLGFFKWNYDHPQSFGFTVYVRDASQQTVLREGSLQLLVGNSRPEEAIDPSGSVFFRDMPASYKNIPVRVELLGISEYQFTNGTRVDTLELTGKAATLIVEPDRRRCCLTGLVVDRTGDRVANAQVWLGTLTPVKTDSLGRFTIVLPVDRRMEETFEVYVRKGRAQGSVRTNPGLEPTVEISL